MSEATTDNKPLARRKTDTDWTALRLEYINGTLSLRDLADKHGVNHNTILARSAREKWEDKRKQLQSTAITVAQEKLTEDRIEQLLQFSAKDIELAILAKEKVELFLKSLQEATEAQTLNTLTNALATAQKIGRLALGAETSNSKVTATTTTVDRKETLSVLMAEINQITANISSLPAPKQ